MHSALKRQNKNHMLLWFLLSLILLFSLFLWFAIRRQLRSHFRNSCFVFHRRFQTLENNKSHFISFLMVGNPGKTLALVLKYYMNSNCWLSPFNKYQFTNLLINKSWVQRLNVLHKLGLFHLMLNFGCMILYFISS